MKIFISIFLILSHLFSTVGFSIEEHECGNEKSYSVFGISLNTLCQCDHDSKEHSKECCKDKKTIVKAKYQDKQTTKIVSTKKLIQDYAVSNPIEFINKNVKFNKEHSYTFGIKHPPNYSQPLYILYNVFLI